MDASDIELWLRAGKVRAARTERGEVVRLLVGEDRVIATFADEHALAGLMGLGNVYQFNAAMALRDRATKE